MQHHQAPGPGEGARREASRRMLIEAWAGIAAHHGVRVSP
jgi:hypothetical protein